MALEEKHHSWFGQHPNAAVLGLGSKTNAAPAGGAAAVAPAAVKKGPPKAAPVYAKTGQFAQMPANSWTGMIIWNFADGSAVVDGGHLSGLGQKLFLEYLSRSGRKFEIVGYTSGVGLDGASKGLDVKRARAVRDALTRKLISNDTFVRTLGKGSSKPLKPDMEKGQISAAGAAQNRRVEILPTNDKLVIPDDILDSGEDVGKVDVPDVHGGKISDKLPPGGSETAEKVITGIDLAHLVTELVELALEGTLGAAGALVAPILLMASVVNAIGQLNKELQRSAFAKGLRLGAKKAQEFIEKGQARVAPGKLLSASSSGITEILNEGGQLSYRNTPDVVVEDIVKAISNGVEESAGIVNKTMEMIEKTVLEKLQKKLDAKKAKTMYDLNIAWVRAEAAARLSKRVAEEVKAVLSKKD